MTEVDVEVYSENSRDRISSSQQQNVCHQVRLKQSIEFVAVNSLDLHRQLESSTTINLMRKLVHFVNWFQTESRLRNFFTRNRYQNLWL
jgi:hypothetical protein